MATDDDTELPRLPRRDVLQWAAAAGLLLAGTACGGASDSADPPTAPAPAPQPSPPPPPPGSPPAPTPPPASPSPPAPTQPPSSPTPPGPPPSPSPPSPPPSTEPIAPSLGAFTEANQAATFRNVDRIHATRNIARGASVTALPPHGRSMSGFRYTHGGESRTVEDWMTRRRIGGWLVLKNGEIAAERYTMGNTETSRWVSFSVAKSFTSTLVGAALHDRSLDSLERRCETILPELRGGGYEGATVRQLLRMASGVRWVEEYGDNNSDIGRFGLAAQNGPPGAVMELMRTRPRAAEPGSRFHYSTGETFVLGAIVSKVTGATLSDYLSARIWSRAGMEANAYWMVEAPNGQEMAGGVLSATLRDYGRFGLVVLRDGLIGNQRVLPVGWRDLAGWPDPSPTQSAGYGYQWWSRGNGVAFVGRGLHGQLMYLNPAQNFLSVIWGAALMRSDFQAETETYSVLAAAIDWLK